MDKDSSLVFNSSGSSDVFNQCPKKMSASIFTAPVAGSGYLGLKPTSKALLPVKDSIAWSSKTVSNGSKTRCMKAGYVHRENSRMPGYYDGRYWTMWKLPMFGCNDSSQILNEIQECKKAYPNAYIRCLAFNNQKQAQSLKVLLSAQLVGNTRRFIITFLVAVLTLYASLHPMLAFTGIQFTFEVIVFSCMVVLSAPVHS
ncbi:hypothetical protein CUMW_026990 [Citrus unshiu]|nr:hypothetical protein CUMW_026990 [Citrus unshiu]